MSTTSQRSLFGVVLASGLLAAMTIPQVWVKPVGDVLQFVVLGGITLDWIWLRVIQPGLRNRGGVNFRN